MTKHFAVICTKNRPSELTNVVGDLLIQSSPVEMILVIDASDCIFHNQIDSLRDLDSKIKVFRTEPGLCKQRNIALGKLPPAGIVTFLDDDVRIQTDYFACVERTFSNDVTTCGVGGRTSEIAERLGLQKLILRIVRADSKKSGKILKSGVNIKFYDDSSAYKVDWLSGCCMSFRLEIVKKLKFDESRPGVGWGEDVDFSLKVAKFGNLVVDPSSPVVHLRSEINRSTPRIQRIQELDSRIKLATDFKDIFSIRLVALHFIALEILYFLENYVSRLKALNERGAYSAWSPRKIIYILKETIQIGLSSFRYFKNRENSIRSERHDVQKSS